MKISWFKLLIILLFIIPAYGQSVSVPAQVAEGSAANGSNDRPVSLSTPTSPSTPVELPATNPSFPVLRTIGGMGLVLCLMIGGYFAAKKIAPRFFAKGSSDRNLKVIETLSMGDKRSIAMIEVGNSRFLIGNTPHQINLLAALPEPLSMVSEPEILPAVSKRSTMKEPIAPFRNLFEVEKKRPTQYAGNPLPEDIRTKMRQLRESLER